MSTSGGSSNEFPFGTSQAFGQETKMFLSGKDDEFPISAIDRKLWQGKTTVKISDLEKAQNDVAKLEDGVNRAVRHMNRSLNQKVNWVNDVVANTNANFETLKVQFVTLTERVDILEQDNDGTNSGGTVSITNQNRASLAPFATPMGNAQPNQVVPNQVPIHQLSSEDEDDGPTLFGLNMLSSGPTDYLSVSGKVYTEQEKVTRLKLALRDTPRALFKELLPAQTDTLDSALSELRQKLDSPQRREIAKRTLSLCKQREDETVTQFLRRLTPLVDATNSSLTGDIRKEKICEEFLDRLKPNISFLIRLVGLSRAKDLDLVRAQAEELEALLLMNKGDEASRLSQAVNALNNQSSQSQWSTEANQNNDRAGQWSSDNNVRGFRPFSGSNATRQQRRGRGGRGRSRNWGGGRQEQFSQRNWSSNPRCHYCDRAGHFAYNCHQRRANFRGNSNQSFRQGRWSNQQPRQSQGQWQNRQNPVNMMDATSSSNTSPGFFENLAKSLLDLKIQDNRNYKNEEPRSGAMNALTLLPAQTDTLDSALSELRQKLDSPQRREIAKRTLSLCKQREDETVTQFLRRLTPLVDATNSSLTGDIRKEKICEEFLDRLKPNISFLIRLVGLSRAKDLDLVRAQAEELEALLLMNKGDEASRLSQAVNALNNQSSQSQWSTEANQNNDRAGQWSSDNNVRGFRPFSVSNATRQQRRGRGGRGRSRNWGGGRQEQFSQRNWSSNPRCHYCDRAGHFAYNCHQRRANFRGNSNQSFRQGRWSNQQPRQSQGQWQNRQNPVNMMDATSSSNTSPGFFENLAKSLLDLKIQDNRNYKNEEPRSGAMNALTHIKPEATAMDCQTKIMSQHGSTVMQSPLGSVNNCQFKAGQCEMEDKTLLMWDTNTTRACEFSKIGTWKGLQLDNIWISDELVAKVAGPELIKVWPCIELQEHDYEFAKIGNSIDSEFECFDKIPIKFRVKDNKRMAFIDPRTMILSSDARLAPCSEYRKQLIFVRGSLYEVDQIDAQVKPVNANRIDGFSLNLSLAPTYARHSFLHLALVNVSDFIGQFYDANLARESELTFQINGEDTVITKTLSEQWEQVSESLRSTD
ncbi:hypothetical protein niasHT_004024 [Heterodera trifolii]|uniref:CCHC-type domain-containing protein n=1 Tax=Heterodera trifolii TaxID=157864 RepID=A0ABD2LTG4_9BILA